MKAQFQYVNYAGTVCDGVLELEDYKRASTLGMSATQYMNAKYHDADVQKYGTAFQQGCQNLGIYTKSDPDHGIRVSKVGDILDGSVVQRRAAGEGLSSGGGIVAPSQQGTTPATRVFFPEVVMQIINEILQDDYSVEEAAWASMIGSKESIDQEMYTQPMINVEAPKAERSAPITQNALPKTMVSITSSQYSKSIVTNSIGLQISDQAIQRSSVDLLGLIFSQQAKQERITIMWEDISNMLNGNLDTGDGALAQNAFTTYDAAAVAGTVTQTGWIKYLYDPSRTISIDSIICDLDTYLAIQNRVGRPVIFDPNTAGTNTGNLGTYGLNVEPNLLNVSIGVPNVLIVATAVLGANLIMGFDSRFAIREVTNVSASYTATEQMVLQRSNFFRVDWGRMAHRLYDSAFLVTDIT